MSSILPCAKAGDHRQLQTRFLHKAMLALALAVCLASPAMSEEVGRKLMSGKLGMTKNVSLCAGNILCGQPSPMDLALAKTLGITTVITLRTDDEIDWDEAKVVEDLGLTFYPIGFRSPDSLTDDVIKRSVEILARSKQSPVMLHCASANRVGAIWMAHRVINDGLSVDAAAVEGKQVGLRTAAYETKIRDYIKRQPR